jgi:hypothetical protein
MPAEIHNKIGFYQPEAYYSNIAGNRYLPIIQSETVIMHTIIAWEQNTGESGNDHVEDVSYNMHSFKSNRQYIKLEQSFKQQLDSFKIFSDQNQYLLKEKMKLSAEAILNYSPDKISLQLTYEGSIFYTFIKGNTVIYFQHFLIDEFDDSDEAIISIYKDQVNIINFAGSLTDVILELNNEFMPDTSFLLSNA